MDIFKSKKDFHDKVVTIKNESRELSYLEIILSLLEDFNRGKPEECQAMVEDIVPMLDSNLKNLIHIEQIMLRNVRYDGPKEKRGLL